jgi:hypothetical protein
MLESPLIDELVMERYGDVIAEKTRKAHEEGGGASTRVSFESQITRLPPMPASLDTRIALFYDRGGLPGW